MTAIFDASIAVRPAVTVQSTRKNFPTRKIKSGPWRGRFFRDSAGALRGIGGTGRCAVTGVTLGTSHGVSVASLLLTNSTYVRTLRSARGVHGDV